ncbi:nucleotidyltransferase [Sporosarcina sp. FSL W7-1349]|uniref:nucleotidyltransferase n=1 Tax=Sporosarcina sp. FSL W7-1349 TaxID=2921561 RepID=UPI0030FBE1D4
MLIQKKIIQDVKNKCLQDHAVSACMMYGSFTKNEGDPFSDVEFYLFIDNESMNHFNSRQWISEVHPVDLLFFNEYGTQVAIFSNMIRGEFHFLTVSEMDIVKSFKPTGVFPDTESMFLYDSTGRLKSLLEQLEGPGPDRMTDENVNFTFNNFVNAWVLGLNVMRRGELARSLEVLTQVQKYVLQLIRVKEESVERWVNSTKNVESDISCESYRDFVSITSKLEVNELRNAYTNALNVVQGLYNTLVVSYVTDVDDTFIRKLYNYLDK